MKKGRMKEVALALMLGVSLLVLPGCSGQSSGAPEGLDKLGGIEAVTREADSGTRGTFDDLTGIVSESKKITEAASTDEMLSTVGQSDSAIGYLTQDALDKSVKALKVEGKDVGDSKYPMTRKLYLVYKGEASDLEQEFITFVTGKGQDIVKKEFEPVKKTTTFLSLKPVGTLKISGSSSEAPVMQELAEAYMKENPNATVTVETSDSGTGINDALEGKCDLGMSSRSPKSYEENLLTFTAVAKDRIAVIVSKDNPMEDITLEQLKAIYTGKASQWTDLFQ